MLQNGGKNVKRNRAGSIEDKQGQRQAAQAFVGASLLVQHKLDSSTASLSQHSGEDKEETSCKNFFCVDFVFSTILLVVSSH
jgi:hypothetical protein